VDINPIRLIVFDVTSSLLDWRQILEPFLKPDAIPPFMKEWARQKRESNDGSAFGTWQQTLGLHYPGIKYTAFQNRLESKLDDYLHSDVHQIHFLSYRVMLAAAGDGHLGLSERVARSLSISWDFQFMSHEAKCFSHDPSYWQKLLLRARAELGVEPNQILYVTSDTFGSIDSARSLGVQACYVPRPYIGSAVDGADANPELMASDLSQVEFGVMQMARLPVRYTVSATAQHPKTSKEFINWMRREHGSDLLKVNGCLEFRVYQRSPLVTQAEYIFRDRAALDQYLNHQAAALRQKGLEFFPPEVMLFDREIMPMVAAGVSRRSDDFGVAVE
jgi:FMN phosphatase YigB (HAD superfamily)